LLMNLWWNSYLVAGLVVLVPARVVMIISEKDLFGR